MTFATDAVVVCSSIDSTTTTSLPSAAPRSSVQTACVNVLNKAQRSPVDIFDMNGWARW
jgi:hypothetical protein